MNLEFYGTLAAVFASTYAAAWCWVRYAERRMAEALSASHAEFQDDSHSISGLGKQHAERVVEVAELVPFKIWQRFDRKLEDPRDFELSVAISRALLLWEACPPEEAQEQYTAAHHDKFSHKFRSGLVSVDELIILFGCLNAFKIILSSKSLDELTEQERERVMCHCEKIETGDSFWEAASRVIQQHTVKGGMVQNRQESKESARSVTEEAREIAGPAKEHALEEYFREEDKSKK